MGSTRVCMMQREISMNTHGSSRAQHFKEMTSYLDLESIIMADAITTRKREHCFLQLGC